MKSHKRVIYKRFNWRTLLISLTILWCAVAGHYSTLDNTYSVEPQKALALMEPIVVDYASTTEEKIAYYFPRNATVMVAIAKAESGLSMDAKGYNCYYLNGVATRTPVKGGSRACNPEDRGMAWSADCFVLQHNQKGTSCPHGVTVDEHLQQMSELSKVCGLNCWWAYKNGSYLKYMPK